MQGQITIMVDQNHESWKANVTATSLEFETTEKDRGGRGTKADRKSALPSSLILTARWVGNRGLFDLKQIKLLLKLCDHSSSVLEVSLTFPKIYMAFG